MTAGFNSTNGGNAGSVRTVDMRSDTVTKPTPGMLEAMVKAEVGDDVFGDDPTVKALEKKVAEMMGKEAGLFVTSGTQGNLLAVGAHCSGRGEEVILGKESHVFFYEQGGASSLMSVPFNTVPNRPDGTLDLEEVRKAIRPNDQHFAQAKLLVLENTHNKMGGKVLSIDYIERAAALCKELGLILHIDGARLWNAMVALDKPGSEIVKAADTVNLCLSKGLGAPVGSVLVGPADFIARARRLRKAVGGGMRQAGVLAAAGLYALENNIWRMKEDHSNAKRLGDGLTKLGLEVTAPDTNMVFWNMDNALELCGTLQQKGIRVLCIDGQRRCRAVANLHISSEDIDYFLEVLGSLLQGGSPAKKARTN